MSEPNNQLLVPIKVEALVIDSSIPGRAKLTKDKRGRVIATEATWSPRGSKLKTAMTKFGRLGPPPFFDAELYAEQDTHFKQLFLKKHSLPKSKDCGVYLHWVLPPGLRHAHGPLETELAFPPLPDQWLIVRFARSPGADDSPVARAWFVDSAVLDPPGPAEARVVVPSAQGPPFLEARKVGASAEFPFPEPEDDPRAGSRTTITALGTAHTGSPSFTACTADNRNVLSFHDDLTGLEAAAGSVLSYLVLGWYHAVEPGEPSHEPLAHVRARLSETDLEHGEKTAVLQALGWQCDSIEVPDPTAEKRRQAEADLPSDLLSRTSLFHGMVANVNYFDRKTYKGPLLGSPRGPFKIGIGNNTADAAIALLADAAAGSKTDSYQDRPALWKALEAVIYRQTDSLVQGWREKPREFAVHKSWFSPQDAGLRWNIAGERDATTLEPAAGGAPAKRPTAEEEAHLYSRLEELNERQARVNQLAQELESVQEEYYARWWLRVRSNLNVFDRHEVPSSAELETALDALDDRIRDLKQKLETERPKVQSAHDTLQQQLAEFGKELRRETAARFWRPADPVIVIQGAGSQQKHEFPTPLVCRSQAPEAAKFVVRSTREGKVLSSEFSSPVAGNLEAIKEAAKGLPAGSSLCALIDEADKVEQAMHELARRTQPEVDPATSEISEPDWQEWTQSLRLALEGAFPDERLRVTADDDSRVLPRLVQLWGTQPWSPLYMDWQVTWHPDENLLGRTGQQENASAGLGEAWRLDAEANDYEPTGQGSSKSVTLQGRSLMAPQLGRVFTDPIDELRVLLREGEDAATKADDAGGEPRFHPAVAKILGNHLSSWDVPLRQLEESGLLGQALSGFQQVLLGRDVDRPRITPDARLPWLSDNPDPNIGGSKRHNDRALHARGTLEPPVVPLVDEEGRLVMHGKALLPAMAPPVIRDYAEPTDERVPFGLLQGGHFSLDALWIVDDFGQWLDLLGGATQGYSKGVVISPHSRWSSDPRETRITRPPRVSQPARLHFRFVDRDFEKESGGHVESDPVCGWVFHNYLDQALTLCDAAGHLLGELVLLEGPDGRSVRWECLKAGHPSDGPLDTHTVPDSTLLAFAEALLESSPSSQTKLQALLALIDDSLGTIRPSTTHHRLRLAGRPLALVNARIGLELFGRAWSDPFKLLSEPPASDPSLDQLRLPVRLGHSPLVEDGLIGYFKRTGESQGMGRIVAVRRPDNFVDTSGYLLDAAPEKDAVRVGFGRPATAAGPANHGWRGVTLLMDPHGEVHASSGLLPAKSLRLPKAYLDRVRDNMELSFRIAPLMLTTSPGAKEEATAEDSTQEEAPPTCKFPVHLPAGWKGRWGFETTPAELPTQVVPPDAQPDYSRSVPRAVEGRLVLRKEHDGTGKTKTRQRSDK